MAVAGMGNIDVGVVAAGAKSGPGIHGDRVQGTDFRVADERAIDKLKMRRPAPADYGGRAGNEAVNALVKQTATAIQAGGGAALTAAAGDQAALQGMNTRG
jgi:hypothetical protein